MGNWMTMAVVLAAALAAGAAEMKPQMRCYRSFLRQFERTKDFADMGITLRTVFAANTVNSLGTPYCEYPQIWEGFGKYNWKAYDDQIGDLVRASPEAKFVVMVDLTMPYWATRTFQGDAYEHVTDYCMDARWRRETARWLRDFLAHSERAHGDRVVAYVISGGKTSEWYEYEDGHSSGRKDAAWREWCARKGRTGRKPYCPPGPVRYEAAFEGRLLDPATQGELIDYWRFHNEIVADAVLFFAHEARAKLRELGAADRRQLGAFFGYYLMNDWRQTSFGHLDYGRVFASPDLDFVIAPGNYSDRVSGGASGSQLPVGSAHLRGKRLMHEIDCWPHGHKMGWGGYFKTEADDFAGNVREAAFALVNHTSCWWFDMWGGFYDNPALRRRIAVCERIQRRFADDLSPSVAQVLYVCDPDSAHYICEKSSFSDGLYRHFHNRLGRTGLPFDVLSFDDLAVADLSRYRIAFLPASVNLTPEKAKTLRERLCRDGRTVAWCYAPGISDGVTLDLKRVRTWAGVDFKTPGVSVTDMGGWRAVYAADPALYTSETLARLCVEAGAHRYVDELSPVYANARVLAIHSATGGEKTIRLPFRAARVVDLMEDRVAAEGVESFTLRFAAPDTKILELVR